MSVMLTDGGKQLPSSNGARETRLPRHTGLRLAQIRKRKQRLQWQNKLPPLFLSTILVKQFFREVLLST